VYIFIDLWAGIELCTDNRCCIFISTETEKSNMYIQMDGTDKIPSKILLLFNFTFAALLSIQNPPD